MLAQIGLPSGAILTSLWRHVPGYGHDRFVNPSQLSHTAMPTSTAAIVSPAIHRFATTDRSLSYRLDHLSFH